MEVVLQSFETRQRGVSLAEGGADRAGVRLHHGGEALDRVGAFVRSEQHLPCALLLDVHQVERIDHQEVG